MAAVARGIDETSNAVQLNGFYGKTFHFYNFSQSATLPVCLFVSSFVNLHFFCLSILQRWIFFKVLVWALRELYDVQLTSCWMVQRFTSHGHFIFGKQRLSFFRGNKAFQQNRRWNFSHFLDMVETRLFFTFFVKVNC